MIFIVPAEIEDARELTNVCIKAFEEDKLLYGEMPPKLDTVMWHKQNILAGQYYKIIEDNIIVGGIKLFHLQNGYMRVGTIYIDPDYQNRGIGSEALKFIENQFSKVKIWSLDTPYKSYRNHHFYEKLGYSRVGEEKPDPGKEFCLYVYEKKV